MENYEKLNHVPSLNWEQLIEVKTFLLHRYTDLIKDTYGKKLTERQLRINLVQQAKLSTYTAAICMRQIELLDENDELEECIQ